MSTPALALTRVPPSVMSTWNAVKPWLGLVFLWLLFELPSAIAPGGLDLAAIRPTLDVLALFTLWAVSHVIPRGQRALRVALFVTTCVLVVFRLDIMIFTLLMRDEPLLYDQLFMLRHLLVLISDLMSPKTLMVVGGFVLSLVIAVYAARRILKSAQVLFAKERLRTTKRTFGVAWAIGLLLLFVPWGKERVMRTLTPQLWRNVQMSVATYASVQQSVRRSPYASFRDVKLTHRPDVLFFVVESYGRLLATHEDTRDRHTLLLDKLEDELRAAGWSMASAYSRAPVSGGRSWLAEGTMLMGTPIRYEAVFHHLLAQGERVPHLVSFMKQNGYETVLLAPADRNRPGTRIINRYGFDQILAFEQMDYRGPAMGWGIVPDQYSLAVAREKVLDVPNRKKPVFFDFHLVTSHAPWNAVPPLVQDAKLLNNLKGKFATVPPETDKEGAVLHRLRYFERDKDARHPYMNRFTDAMRRGYQATITYDLKVITRYLVERHDDAIAVIVGDHQPPVITYANASFDTPIHVITKNQAALDELLRQGFLAGLSLPEDQPAAIEHAGIFSLLVRTLVAAGGDKELPPFLPKGHHLLSAR